MTPNPPSSSSHVGASLLATFVPALAALVLLTSAPLSAQPALAPDEVLYRIPDEHP